LRWRKGRNEGTFGSRRKISSTPLAIHTIRALFIPKTNSKLDSNPKTKYFPWNPHGRPREKMECKWGRRGVYHAKGQPLALKREKKRSPLSKTTKLSKLQGMSFLGEKGESTRAFVVSFSFFKVEGKFITPVIPSFHI